MCVLFHDDGESSHPLAPHTPKPCARTHCGDVCVVPRVVVDDDGAVGHGGDLVSVVPPAHHHRIRGAVMAQPGVGLGGGQGGAWRHAWGV